MRVLNRIWQLVALALSFPVLGIAIVTKEAGLWLIYQFKDEDWTWPE